MFIAGKIILKCAVLATAATPLLSTTSADKTASDAPNIPVILQYKSADGSSNLIASAQLSAADKYKTFIVPGKPGEPAVKGYSTPHWQQNNPQMSNIPKSYEIYSLYRSDGVLIGPNGVAPLPSIKPEVKTIIRNMQIHSDPNEALAVSKEALAAKSITVISGSK